MKVEVLGKKIKVKLSSHKELYKDVGHEVYGYFCKEKKEIHIDYSLNKELREITLLHELCHVVMWITGLDQVISHSTQEIICESFANTWHPYMCPYMSETLESLCKKRIKKKD